MQIQRIIQKSLQCYCGQDDFAEIDPYQTIQCRNKSCHRTVHKGCYDILEDSPTFICFQCRMQILYPFFKIDPEQQLSIGFKFKIFEKSNQQNKQEEIRFHVTNSMYHEIMNNYSNPNDDQSHSCLQFSFLEFKSAQTASAFSWPNDAQFYLNGRQILIENQETIYVPLIEKVTSSYQRKNQQNYTVVLQGENILQIKLRRPFLQKMILFIHFANIRKIKEFAKEIIAYNEDLENETKFLSQNKNKLFSFFQHESNQNQLQQNQQNQQKLENGNENDSNDEQQIILSLEDSLDNHLITVPVRGKNCNHKEPFCLVSFLKHYADSLTAFKCPICQNLLDFTQIEYDAYILLTIRQLIGQDNRTKEDLERVKEIVFDRSLQQWKVNTDNSRSQFIAKQKALQQQQQKFQLNQQNKYNNSSVNQMVAFYNANMTPYYQDDDEFLNEEKSDLKELYSFSSSQLYQFLFIVSESTESHQSLQPQETNSLLQFIDRATIFHLEHYKFQSLQSCALFLSSHIRQINGKTNGERIISFMCSWAENADQLVKCVLTILTKNKTSQLPIFQILETLIMCAQKLAQDKNQHNCKNKYSFFNLPKDLIRKNQNEQNAKLNLTQIFGLLLSSLQYILEFDETAIINIIQYLSRAIALVSFIDDMNENNHKEQTFRIKFDELFNVLSHFFIMLDSNTIIGLLQKLFDIQQVNQYISKSSIQWRIFICLFAKLQLFIKNNGDSGQAYNEISNGLKQFEAKAEHEIKYLQTFIEKNKIDVFNQNFAEIEI